MAYDRTRLTEAELQTFLTAHPRWSREGEALLRSYSFPRFLDGISFVEQVAAAAERHDHHPDIDIRYTKVTLRLSTHDADGLTFRDLKLAADCDALPLAALAK